MPSLHHVAVRTSDLDRSVRFYRDAFGLGPELRWNHPPMVEAAAFLPFAGGGWLELFAGADPAEGEAPADTASGIVHLAFACEDVDAAFNRAIQHGAAPLDAPATRSLFGSERELSARMAFVIGPSGEVIELYRNDDLTHNASA